MQDVPLLFRTTPSSSCVGNFTTDIWTSAATEGYISLTCHYISSKWALESCCLGTVAFSEQHTADNIAEKLTALTERFSLPKLAQVGLVHDQAASMEAEKAQDGRGA